MRQAENEAGGLLIWFTGRPRPFLMEESYCANPDCPCNTVTLSFEEVCEDGARLAEPIRFDVELSLDNWAEVDSKDRCEPVERYVAEFLRELPESLREHFRKKHVRIRDEGARLATFTMPAQEVREGRLLSYSEILVDCPEDMSQRAMRWFALEFEGQIYAVEDLYCPNPECPCEEVCLAVYSMPIQPDGRVIGGELFFASVTFGGEIRVEELHECTLPWAEKLLEDWLRRMPEDLRKFQQRYERVREIGERSLEAEPQGGEDSRPAPKRRTATPRPGGRASRSPVKRRTPPGTFVRKAPKIRPNDPCPCGSGKKYKKCCGR